MEQDNQDPNQKVKNTANFNTTNDVTREAEEALRLYNALQDGTSTKLRKTTSVFGPATKLYIEVSGTNGTFAIRPESEITIGRRDPATNVGPEIDLAPFAAYQMGVSRQHVLIRLEGAQLMLYDLGSRNGTYLNMKKAHPNQPLKLHDGDELRLGKMVLKLYFRQDSED